MLAQLIVHEANLFREGHQSHTGHPDYLQGFACNVGDLVVLDA